jgi:proteasome-associated ATPase
MPDSDSLELISHIKAGLPADDPKLQNAVSELQRSLEKEHLAQVQLQEEFAQYQAAYEKLTAPANRIGVFLRWLDPENKTLANVLVGDSEYVSEVDPKSDLTQYVMGTRVRVNEAFAVIGIVDHGATGLTARVGEVLDDGRIRLSSETPGADSRIVLRGDVLAEVKISVGDEIRLDSTGRVAIEHFAKSESRDYFFEEVPQTPWEAVGGQEEAIRTIREAIEVPLLHPELYRSYEKRPPKGILLYGPPGCGKTLIGKATAYNLTREYSKQVGHEVNEYFMMISGPKILNMWLGETERMVREIFKTAREKAKEGRLVFIFMDEAESILRTRSSGRWLNISNTVVPQFCAELDGLVSLDNVVLMLTSNRPDYIDPAVLRPERIDRKIKISRPDRAASTQILSIYLHHRLPLDPEILAKYDGEVDCARRELVEATIDKLWSKDADSKFLEIRLRNGKTETLYRGDLVSGALLKSVVERAKDYAIRRAIEHPKDATGIGLDDLLLALKTEYSENEIFPKSDTAEDWLRLLDHEPENVVGVKPVGLADGRNRGPQKVV